MDTLTFITELLKIFTWPLTILIILVFFKEPLLDLIRNIKKIKKGDFEAEFDKKADELVAQEVIPIQDQLDKFRKEIEERLEQEFLGGEKIKSRSTGMLTDEPSTEDVISTRVFNALQNGPYEWRSIDRLAMEAATSNEKVLEILRKDDNVKLSRGRSGRQIARFLD